MKITFEQFLIHKKKLKDKTTIKIISGSMEPFIYTGEKVECSPCNFENSVVGDPIVFWSEDKFICHFLIAKHITEKGNFIETRGLNTSKSDPLVHENFIFGKVTSPKISWLKKSFFQLLSRFYNKS